MWLPDKITAHSNLNVFSVTLGAELHLEQPVLARWLRFYVATSLLPTQQTRIGPRVSSLLHCSDVRHRL